MSKGLSWRPKLIVNRGFMAEFIDAEPPCLALGILEEQQKRCGFLALKPNLTIPEAVSALGFKFGHSLYGNSTMEVVHFGFEFYGFHTFNVLINPNNPVVQAVLTLMVREGDYFFFCLDSNRSVTAFRSGIEHDALEGLRDNMPRLQDSMTTEQQYQKAVTQFSREPEPEGTLLHWVCRDNIEYLDLSKDPLDLMPS